MNVVNSIINERYGETFVGNAEMHSYRFFGLMPYGRSIISPPEPKVVSVPIPGADGELDLSETLTGFITYENRQGTFKYMYAGFNMYDAVLTRLLERLHGKTMAIIRDEDPGYYYRGRVTVGPPEYTDVAMIVTITANLNPYKYELKTTGEDWLWDPFSFETGVIREYGAFEIDGTSGNPTVVTIVSSPAGGSPTFTASAAMSFYITGVSDRFDLAADTPTTFVDIELPHEETEVSLFVTGTGTLKVDFRPGYL